MQLVKSRLVCVILKYQFLNILCYQYAIWFISLFSALWQPMPSFFFMRFRFCMWYRYIFNFYLLTTFYRITSQIIGQTTRLLLFFTGVLVRHINQEQICLLRWDLMVVQQLFIPPPPSTTSQSTTVCCYSVWSAGWFVLASWFTPLKRWIVSD